MTGTRRGLAALVAVAAVTAGAAGTAHATRPADLDGDGRADLAVGVPYEGIPPSLGGANSGEGAVDLLYGGRQGPRGRGSDLLHRGLPRMAGGGPDPNSSFGAAVATGDFDGNGRADLAVGTPGENGGQFVGPGAVNVIYGRRHGLSLKGDRFLTQGSRGMAGDGNDGGDLFGYALAAGDYDGDGRDDLAIGAPFETLGAGPASAQGAITIVYGSRHGLRAKRSRFLTEETPGVAGDGAEDGDNFGLVLTPGDFNGDRRDDLAVGFREGVVANEDGAVDVLLGSRRGLRAKRSRSFSQQSPGIGGDGGQASEDFGASLAAADFDRDGRDDLAVGTQFENLPGVAQAGAVTVLPGSRGGPQADGTERFTQDSAGMAGQGAAAANDFGARLAAGDFNGDGRPDLAIGARGETITGFPGSGQGAVEVLYSSRRGLRTDRSQFIHQGKLGIAGESPEDDDEFGDALAAGRFEGKHRDDLVVGVPLEDLPAGNEGLNEGVIDVIPASRRGLRPRAARELDQASPRIADRPDANDFFGLTLAPPDGSALINVFD